MAVQTINTDIAAEVNISARRNDTFVFKFSVDNPTTSNPVQGLPLNGGQESTAAPVYQAKMSIVDASTGDIKLTLYSSYYQSVSGSVIIDEDGSNTPAKAQPPTAILAGEYSGLHDKNGSVKTGGAINFKNNSSTAGSLAVVSVPYNYMVFEPGEYLYDLQIREQTVSGTDAAAKATIKYTTWMYGKFTLNADITSF